MAKITITFEDVEKDGERGVTFSMDMVMTPSDHTIPSHAVTPAAGLGFAVRSLWREGVLYDYAGANIDALIEEAALEIAVSKQAAVNKNICEPVS